LNSSERVKDCDAEREGIRKRQVGKNGIKHGGKFLIGANFLLSLPGETRDGDRRE